MESGIRESRAVLVRQRQGRPIIVDQGLLKRKETQITTRENPEVVLPGKCGEIQTMSNILILRHYSAQEKYLSTFQFTAPESYSFSYLTLYICIIIVCGLKLHFIDLASTLNNIV